MAQCDLQHIPPLKGTVLIRCSAVGDGLVDYGLGEQAVSSGLNPYVQPSPAARSKEAVDAAVFIVVVV